MVVIDHQFFPHIIDEIWRTMSFASVVAARAVSYTWKKRANKILQHHVYCLAEGTGVRIAVVNPDDTVSQYDTSCPAWFITAEVVERLKTCRRVSSLLLEWRTLTELFSNIRHMDVDEYIGGCGLAKEREMRDLANLSTLINALDRRWALRTLRRFGAYASDEVGMEAEANTTVYFTIEEGYTEIKSCHARNVVLNLIGLPSSDAYVVTNYPTLWNWFVVPGHPSRRHSPESIVLLFHNGNPYVIGDIDRISDGGEEECASWARLLVEYLDYETSVPGFPITLVGLERFFTTSDGYEACKAKLLHMVNGARARAAEGSHNNDTGGGVQVLTHAEYRALVGPYIYWLHTDQMS